MNRSGVIEITSTAILAGVVAVLAAVVARREFFPKAPGRSAVAPSVAFVADWETASDAGHWDGDPKAPVRIIEFADLQCPACREANTTLRRLRRKYGSSLSIAFVHFPLSTIHPFARPAALASECVGQSGKFESFVDAVYARQGSLGLISWTAFAKDAGVVDTSSFAACLRDPRSVEYVERGVAAGRRLGVESTPSLLVNGWRVSGAVGYADLSAIIDSVLAGRSPPGAVAPPKVAVVGANDSVRVVSNDQKSVNQAAAYSLSREPSLETGADLGAEFDLTYVEDAIPLSDGRLIAYSPVGVRLVLFDSFGRGKKVLAKRGEGPGDIAKALNLLHVGRDTVAMIDIGTRRISFFHPDLGALTSRMVSGTLRPGTKLGGLLTGNRILAHTAGVRQPGTSAADVRSKALLSVMENEKARDILSVADLHLVEVEMKYGKTVSRSVSTLRLGGTTKVAVWDTLVAVVPVDARRIDLFNSSGGLVTRIELPGSRRPVTRQMQQLVIDKELEMLRSAQQERPVNLPELERLARQAPFADSLPASHAVFASNDGSLWLVEPIAPGQRGWSALSIRRDGSVGKRLTYSGDGAPIGIMNGRVALRIEDSDGVVRIRVHQIVPSQLNPR